jgi:hypothetical protein
VLGRASSSTSNLGVNAWLWPLDLADFSHFPQNLGSSSLSKIEREIFGFEKKTIWELIPCVEMTLMSNFHSILCLVAQESRLGRKCLVLTQNCAQFYADRTSPGQYLDKSRTVLGGLVRD